MNRFRIDNNFILQQLNNKLNNYINFRTTGNIANDGVPMYSTDALISVDNSFTEEDYSSKKKPNKNKYLKYK